MRCIYMHELVTTVSYYKMVLIRIWKGTLLILHIVYTVLNFYYVTMCLPIIPVRGIKNDNYYN